MKRVLVTGASGFLGRYTTEPLLGRGWTVHTVSRRPGGTSDDGVVAHQCDLFEPDAADQLLQAVRPTHLLHLAWDTEHGKFWTSDDNLRWVRASLDLFLAARDVGVERIVAAGTCAEYDWSHSVCHEFDTPTRPGTLYGSAKNSVREVLSSFASVNDLSWCWGRVFFPYGPGEPITRLIPSTIRSVLEGDVGGCRFGGHERDYVFVEDAAEAFVSLLESPVQGPVNVGSGSQITLGELMRQLGELTGHPERINVERQPGSPSNPTTLLPDCRRLLDEVGWRPRTDIREGLMRSIEDVRLQSYRSQHVA